MRQQVDLAATSTASVSIVGPPGSGRQHAARAIHYGRAPQAAGPLVPLACPLLATELLETTLRAMTRTGAATQRPATLWLCDVEDLDDEVQQQLVRELAGNRTFRMIAAHLARAACRAGRGRQVPRGSGLCPATIEIAPAARRAD